MDLRIISLTFVFICYLMSYSFAQDGIPLIPFEQNENRTATYQEGIEFYESLSSFYRFLCNFWGAGRQPDKKNKVFRALDTRGA